MNNEEKNCEKAVENGNFLSVADCLDALHSVKTGGRKKHRTHKKRHHKKHTHKKHTHKKRHHKRRHTRRN